MSGQRQVSSTTYPMLFLMVLSSDHITAATGLTPTVTISKNGAAFGSAAGAVTEVGSGWYALAGNATDRNTLGELKLHATAATADPSDKDFEIVTVDPFAALGAVTSVSGAVGSVTGNIGGNVVGSVGSVTGNVGGNVTGSIGSLATQAKADVAAGWAAATLSACIGLPTTNGQALTYQVQQRNNVEHADKGTGVITLYENDGTTPKSTQTYANTSGAADRSAMA